MTPPSVLMGATFVAGCFGGWIYLASGGEFILTVTMSAVTAIVFWYSVQV